MATNISTFLADELLDHILRALAYTSPTTVYLGLWIGDPLRTGLGGAEVSGGAYVRVAVTMGVPAGQISKNSGNITFASATANWGTITHWAIYDASTAGNQLYQGVLDAPVTINSGDAAFEILTNGLEIGFN